MPEPSPLEPFIVRLERLGIPYFVTGSTAGIVYGEPRLTHDVDIDDWRAAVEHGDYRRNDDGVLIARDSPAQASPLPSTRTSGPN